jgi:hypothetical protein
MRRIPVLATFIGAFLLLALPATASASGYVTYGACGTTAAAQPSHSCSKSSSKAAFFKSKNSSAVYGVCVKFPNGQKLCANAQSAAKGQLRHNTITSTQKGQHKITWKVGGTKVGTWYLNVT